MAKKRLSVAAGALVTCMLLVSMLYMAVISFAFVPTSYEQEPPFDEMAQELTAYLSGEREALSPLFTQRERLHMEDVLGLFTGGERLATACLWAALVLCVVALLLGGRVNLGNGLLLGLGVFAAVAVGVAIWAAVDFNGWFTAMHYMAFDNDLWLLDPAESMLIQMMPLTFFIDAVKTIALRFGLCVLLVALLAAACKLPRKKKENLWSMLNKAPDA